MLYVYTSQSVSQSDCGTVVLANLPRLDAEFRFALAMRTLSTAAAFSLSAFFSAKTLDNNRALQG